MPASVICPACQTFFSKDPRRLGAANRCPVCRQPWPDRHRSLGQRFYLDADVGKTRPRAVAKSVQPPPLPTPAGIKQQAVIDRRVVGMAATIAVVFVAGSVLSAMAWNANHPQAKTFDEAANFEAALPAVESLLAKTKHPAPKPMDPEPKESKPATDRQIPPKVAPANAEPARRRFSILDASVLHSPEFAFPGNEPPARPDAAHVGPIGLKGRTPKLVMQRIRHVLPDDLGRSLLLAPEINLDAVPGTSNRVLASAKSRKNLKGFTAHLGTALLEQRQELSWLPMRMGYDCQLGKESAQTLQVLSRKLRSHLAESIPTKSPDPRIDVQALRDKLLGGMEHQNCEWLRSEAVPTLVQLLQAEDKPVRLLLVELLDQITGPPASAALVQRALFDLDADVREAALHALKDRPLTDCRESLLAGFRYPWAPAAEHAAEALVALQDRAALPQLAKLLEEPDPAAPYVDEKRGLVKRELVRVNHLHNCLLCHSPSLSTDDPVRGLVPTPGQPLSPPSSQPYYEGTNGIFVRADVSYLKQDFAVPQPVEKAGAWPAFQRYDYLVRTRPLTPKEEIDQYLGIKDPMRYPQREAVRFALRELSGRNDQ